MKHHYAPADMTTDHAEKVADVLQERLSSLIDLSLILKHVHWNVVGMGFVAVHEMMDEQTDTVRDLVDEMAERISTLGGVAAGLAGQVTEMREAEQDYALGRADVMAHLGALDRVYAQITTGHRRAIEEVGEIDPVSEDLLVGQAGKLEMAHWFIRAHISNVEGELVTEDADTQLDAAAEAAHALQPGLEEEAEETEEPKERQPA